MSIINGNTKKGSLLKSSKAQKLTISWLGKRKTDFRNN
ncbi:hypothetical protein LEP1GSC088_3944 [Leptospira interrogans str. L1207]|nr:hypothetical protein LEP1GSC088_3944 [Leptospira interrogans str. L1207]